MSEYGEKYREDRSVVLATSLWIELNRWLESYHTVQLERSRALLAKLLEDELNRVKRKRRVSWEDLARQLGFKSREELRFILEKKSIDGLSALARSLFPSVRFAFASLRLSDATSIFPQIDLFSLQDDEFKIYFYCLFYRPRFTQRDFASMSQTLNKSFREIKGLVERLVEKKLVRRNGEEFELIFDPARGINSSEKGV